MKIGLKYGFWLSVLVLLFSCDVILFEDPQPLSVKNQYEFPKEFIGTWYELEDGQQQQTLFINKYQVFWYENRNDVSILKKQVDTSSKYCIYNEKIYEINPYEELFLSQGFPYQIRNDSVFYEHKTINEVALSRINFIRKVDNMYLLNMKNENQWYSILLCYINNNNHLIVRGISSKDIAYLNQEHILFQKYKGEGAIQLFTTQQFNKSTLLQFIHQGGFSDTLMNLSYHTKSIQN